MPLKLASREYVHILNDAALLPLRERYVIDIKEKKRKRETKWLMILITTIIWEQGVGTRSSITVAAGDIILTIITD